MATIKLLHAREILDSRGLPTIECLLWLDSGQFVQTSVPAGTSIGKYEAKELRDNDPTRMAGQGVQQAVALINTQLAPQIIGKDPTDQAGIDQLLIDADGTPNKAKLGANTTLAISQAVLKAAALSQGLPLYKYIHNTYQLTDHLEIPTCIFGVINGGEHGADNLDIQEFQIIPASFYQYSDALSMAVTIFHKLEEVLITKGAIHSVGISGGFAPNLYNNTDAFEILIETTKATPYTFAQDVFFGVDVEASTFYSGGKYTLKDKSQPYSAAEMLEYYKRLRQQYHVFYIEDAFHEDDWESWHQLTAELGSTTNIAGDTLLSTNPKNLEKAIQEQACNSAILKPNQVGTITETMAFAKQAKEAGWQLVVSHRSGETNDDISADIAVGVGADFARFGPPNRGERVSKYNRLLQIEAQLLRANA